LLFDGSTKQFDSPLSGLQIFIPKIPKLASTHNSIMKNLHNQTTILLIENDSDWLVDVYSVLQEAGYDVLIATGGDEGFCVARRVRPDLIVCESALPDISGVQLCYRTCLQLKS